MKKPSPYADNIRMRMMRAGLTAKELSRRAGLGDTAVHDILSGNSGSPRAATLEKLAAALGCDVADLYSATPESFERKVLPLPIVGAVEAGVWREALEWPQSEWIYEPVPEDTRFPGMRRFGLRVQGESMNQLYRPGDYVVCIKMIDLKEPPVAGRRYVVYRQNSDGLIEATLKEFAIDAQGNQWLMPRSDNPRYQSPIDYSGAEGGEVTIYARVTGSWRREA